MKKKFTHSVANFSLLIILFLGSLTTTEANTFYMPPCPGDGQSLSFDGNNDYVDIGAALPQLVGQSAFSIEFWMKADEANQTAPRTMIFSHNAAPGPGDNKFLIILDAGPVNAGKIVLFDKNTTGTNFELVSNDAVGDDQWHHILYTRTGGVGKLYIDGVDNGSHTPMNPFALTDRLSLGQDWDGTANSDFYQGNLAEVRLWNKSFNASEAQASFNAGELSEITPELIAYYKFEGNGGGTVISDCSPNDNHGTFVEAGGTVNLPVFDPAYPCITHYECNEILLAKAITGIGVAASGTSGNFNVTYQFILKNTGINEATDLNLTDDFTAQFGSAFVGVITPPVLSSSSTVQANSSYTGSIDNMFDTGGSLAPGESLTVDLVVEIDGSLLASNSANSATISAIGTEGLITDRSDSGADPESTNPDAPGDSGGVNDPTPLSDCSGALGSLSCSGPLQVSVGLNCETTFTLLDFVPSGLADCFGNVIAIEDLFTIMVKTAQGTVLPDQNPSTADILELDLSNYIGSTLTYELMNTVSGIKCWNTFTVEDKLGPIITCPASPISVTCLDDLSCVATPTAVDNCGGPVTIVETGSQIVSNDLCTGQEIIKTYIAYDNQANASDPCSVTIQITQAPVLFPQDVQWTCEQYNAYNDIILPREFVACIQDADTGTPIVEVELVPGADDNNCPGGENDTQNGQGCTTALVCNLSFGAAVDCNSADIAGLEDDDLLEITGSGAPNVWNGNTQQFCKYNVSYEDELLPLCGVSMNTFKILRTWRVFNCCTNELIENIQLIIVSDETDPSVSLPSSVELNANTAAQGTHGVCGSSGLLPLPDVSDNCTGVDLSDVTISSSPAVGAIVPFFNNGIVVGYQVSSAPFFELNTTYTVTYQVKDGCDNVGMASMDVTVVDNTPPVGRCDGTTVLSLDGTAASAVFANDLDDGSSDNCADVWFKVLRMDEQAAGPRNGEGIPQACGQLNSEDPIEPVDRTYFDDEAFFCCADLTTNLNMVIVRVFDVDPGPGAINPDRFLPTGDLFGRYNDCMVGVEVQDKIAPVLLFCPPAFDIQCTDQATIQFYSDESEVTLNAPVFNDACDFTITLDVQTNLDACGVGTITRTFTAEDEGGNTSPQSCVQVYNVLGNFDYEIPFPDDVLLECGDTFNPADSLTLAYITQNGCERLGINILDSQFSPTPDGCQALLRTYTIIDWCTLDPNDLLNPTLINNPTTTDQGAVLTVMNGVVTVNGVAISVTSPGIWQYVQMIKDCSMQGNQDDLINFASTNCTSTPPAMAANPQNVTCGGAVNASFETVQGCVTPATQTPTYFVVTEFVDNDMDGTFSAGDGGVSEAANGDGDPYGSLTGTAPNFTISGTYPLGDLAVVVMYGSVTKTFVVPVANCFTSMDVIGNFVGDNCSTDPTLVANPNATGAASCLGSIRATFNASLGCGTSTGLMPTYYVVTEFVDNNQNGVFDQGDGGTSEQGVGDGDPYGQLTANATDFTISGTYPEGLNAFVISYGNATETFTVESVICFDIENLIFSSSTDCSNLNFVGNRDNVVCGGKFAITVEPGICNDPITTIGYNYYEDVTDPTDLSSATLVVTQNYIGFDVPQIPALPPNLPMPTNNGRLSGTLPNVYAAVEVISVNGIPLPAPEIFAYDFQNSDCVSPIASIRPNVTACFENGQLEITATGIDNVNNPSSDGCGGSVTLMVQAYIPNPLGSTNLQVVPLVAPSVTLTGDNTFIDPLTNQLSVQVNLIVTDNAGNSAVNPVRIQVSNCFGSRGSIANLTNQPVEDVQVSITGDYFNSFTTTADGTFEFENIPAGSDITITPEKNIDFGNGVSTYDLYLISQHILGITELDEPTALIAADANNSGNVSAFDITTIRRTILGLDQAFVNNTSWRFVDAKHVYPLPSNPWVRGFPETLTFSDVQEDMLDLDFTAVKIGDVNMSAQANSRQPLAPRTLTGTFTLEAEDAQLAAGETHMLNISTTDTDALGYQLTLNWDPSIIEVVHVVPGAHPASGFGTHLLTEGKLSMSHNGNLNGELFSLEVRAIHNRIKLSEAFTVGSSVTPAEAFAKTGPLNVGLNFGGENLSQPNSLAQNRPNPFSGSTQIGFTLAQAGEASLTVTDATGRMVWRTAGYFEAGFDQIEIDADELPTTGILNYTLTAGDFTATRKMVFVN